MGMQTYAVLNFFQEIDVNILEVGLKMRAGSNCIVVGAQQSCTLISVHYAT